MMKKITAILLSMLVILSPAACGNAGGNPVDITADNDTTSENGNMGNAESVNVLESQPERTGTSEVQPESGGNSEG